MTSFSVSSCTPAPHDFLAGYQGRIALLFPNGHNMKGIAPTKTTNPWAPNLSLSLMPSWRGQLRSQCKNSCPIQSTMTTFRRDKAQGKRKPGNRLQTGSQSTHYSNTRHSGIDNFRNGHQVSRLIHQSGIHVFPFTDGWMYWFRSDHI